MTMINIPSHNTDPNYRYRMPRLVSKVEGRGNGIKTNIMNMAEIARSLKRPPEYPTKFCGTELGAQSKFDSAEGKSIVNGAHETRDLQLLIDKFVEKYVLCPNCSLPEIDLVLKKGIVACHCNACGHNGDLDNAHKLATFMLRNPPKGADSTMGGKGKKTDKREKKRKGKDAKDDGAEEDAEGAAAAEKSKKKKKSGKSSKSKKRDEEGEVVNGVEEGSSEGNGGGARVALHCESGSGGLAPDHHDSKASKRSKKPKAKKGHSVDLLEKESLSYDSAEIVDVKERLVAFISKDADSDKALSSPSSSAASGSIRVSADEFFAELRVLQVSQDFDSVLRLFVGLDALLTPSWSAKEENGVVVTAEMVEDVIPYLRKLIDASMDTTRVCVAVEQFLAMRGKLPDSLENFPFILHKLFLAELLDEEKLIARYRDHSPEDDEEGQNQSSKKVKKESKKYPVNKAAAEAVQPFINWLEEEGESSSEEEEEEPDSSQSGSGTAAPSSEPSSALKRDDIAATVPEGLPSTAASSATAKGDRSDEECENEDDDDLDIDAI